VHGHAAGVRVIEQSRRRTAPWAWGQKREREWERVGDVEDERGEGRALWDDGPGRAIGVEGADRERETDREADGDVEREAGRAEAKYVGGHGAAQPAQESDLGCLAGQAIENQNFSCLGEVRLERKEGISGGVLPGRPHTR
jgi:hypothetical protein